MHTRKRGGRKLFKQEYDFGRQEEEDPALIDPSVGVPVADNLDEAFYDDENDDENAGSINSGFSNIDYSVGEGNFNPFEADTSAIEDEADNIMIQPFEDDVSSIDEEDDDEGVMFVGGKRKNKSMKKRNKKLTRKNKRQRKNKKPRKTVGRRKH